jgi:hypothetical protein
MAYTIYNSDGSVLVTLGEGKADQVSTSLTLIGKNYPNYGETFNNNLIKLLENFANVNEPNSPRTGQIWYDTAEGRIKVYDLNGVFRPITNALSSDVLPVGLANNDFWFDTRNQQMFFTPDANNLYLIGPTDSKLLGRNGWVSRSVPDTNGIFRIITELYSGGRHVGILSTSSFTMAISTSGMTILQAGLNLNQTISGIRFVGTATSADSVQGITVSQLVKNTGTAFQTIVGSLTVQDNNGLVVSNSSLQNIGLRVNPSTQVGTLIYNTADKNLSIEITNSTIGSTSSIYVNAASRYLGIWNKSPAYPVDINGNVFIRGNLTVNGSQTILTSTTLRIYDPNIEIGYPVGVADDVLANGGGITLYGTTNKTITWINNKTGWNFNTNTNITTASTYMIGGLSVITSSTLGTTIATAPGLTKVGVLSQLTVTNVYITGNTIATVGTNQTLYLSASGTGTIDASGERITNVSTATTRLDAANKGYVDDSLYLVSSKNFNLSLDVTNFVSVHGSVDIGVKYYLDRIFPISNDGTNGTTSTDTAYNLPDGIRAKVLCSTVTVPTTTATVNVSYATVTVDKNGSLSSTLVVSGLAGAVTGSLPAQTYTPVTGYTIQTWRTTLGTWVKSAY